MDMEQGYEDILKLAESNQIFIIWISILVFIIALVLIWTVHNILKIKKNAIQAEL